MARCDVLVVGAGAAGCVAALKLSRAGLKTVLIERASKPGGSIPAKIDITQDTGIHGFAKELGIPLAWYSKKSRWFSRNSSFDLHSKVIDLFIKRGPGEDSLECKLAHKSMDAGCELRFSTTIPMLQVSSSSFDSVELETKGKRSMLNADYIIAADGPNSHIVSSCFSAPQAQDGVAFSGFGMLTDRLNLDEDATHVFFDSEHAPGGYFYMASGRQGPGVAAIVVERAAAHGNPPHAYFKKFVESSPFAMKALSGARLKKTFFGGSVARQIPAHHHRNILFAGDAAGLLDPLLGYGLNHAIRSGYYAADSIINNAGAVPEKVAKEYESALAKEILPELSNGESARRFFNGLTNKDFDHITSLVSNISSHVDLDDFLDSPHSHPLPILSAIREQPGALMLLRHIHRLI